MDDQAIADIIANQHIPENRMVIDRDLSDFLGSLNAAAIASVFLARSRPDVGNGWFVLSYADWERLTFLSIRKIRYTIPLMAVHGFLTKSTNKSASGWAKAYRLDRDVFMPKYRVFLNGRNATKWIVPEWVFEDSENTQTDERLCQNVKALHNLSKPLTKLAHVSTNSEGSSRTHAHAGTTPSYDGVEDKRVNATDNDLILQLTDIEKPLSDNIGRVVGGSGGQKGNQTSRSGKTTDAPEGFKPIQLFEQAYTDFMHIPTPTLSKDKCINLNRIGSRHGEDLFRGALSVFFCDNPPWPVKENGYTCATFIKYIDTLIGLYAKPKQSQTLTDVLKASTDRLSPAVKAMIQEQSRKLNG